ncbi:hypothetical protein BGZ76_005902 [Entomortierella beljakovae]|nr:hypothetical protein BGZ76_005902 [Entomortierella beljakovae]
MVYSITPLPTRLVTIQVSILSPEILILIQQNTDSLVSFSCRSNRLRKDQETQALWCRQLFFVLQSVDNLKEFALGPAIILDPPNQEFNKICANLEKLELDRVKVSLPSLYEESVDTESVVMKPFPRLQSLTLIWNDFPPQCQLELIRKSPNLKSLVWKRGTKLLTESWLSRTLAIPQQLTGLDIGNSHLRDEDMARVIHSIPTLTSLHVRSTPFSNLSFNQLMNHQGANMVQLDLAECTEISSSQIFTVLTSMPKLTKFSASMLKATDFARALPLAIGSDFEFQSQQNSEQQITHQKQQQQQQQQQRLSIQNAWACLDLKELDISIVGPEECSEQELLDHAQSIYNQIGGLKRLETLVLKEVTTDYVNHGPLLNLTLAHGLDRLLGLKRLRELDVHGLTCEMKTAEIEWMASEWINLVEFKGSLSPAPSIKSSLRQLKKIMPGLVVIL